MLIGDVRDVSHDARGASVLDDLVAVSATYEFLSGKYLYATKKTKQFSIKYQEKRENSLLE